MFKMIKIIIFSFCLLFTTHAFGKSNEYYQKTLVHILTECNSDCHNCDFENTAIIFSISNTAKNGGLIGWINELQISKLILEKIGDVIYS